MNDHVVGVTSIAPPRFGLSVPLAHFFLSLLVAASVAFLVFFIWFPGEYKEIAGGLRIFWIIVAVDCVSGPFLTWLVYSKSKTRLAIAFDLSIIVILQIGALVYGLNTLGQARPLALVYEVDRFRLISFADIYEPEAEKIPEWLKVWGVSDVRTMGIRKAGSLEEKIASVDASLQGVEPSQRPSWWQEYSLSVPQVLAKSKSIADLKAKYPTRQEIISVAIESALGKRSVGETGDPNELRWLPLVSRSSMNWVVILDPVTARIRAFAPLDGF